MNEMHVLSNLELVEQADNILVDTLNMIDDLIEGLANSDTPQGRLVTRTINNLSNEIYNKRMVLFERIVESKKDERAEHLSNLRGYFNEETGTWYEQINTIHKKLTGCRSNKWSALTFTIDLLNGASVFGYMVHHGIVELKNGKYTMDLTNAEVFGNDIERCKFLIDTDFQELRNMKLEGLREVLA